MKTLLLTLLLSMSQITSADELSDFEVLGMSIGDSLMDFMPEVDILYEIEKYKSSNRYSHLKEPDKFFEITVPKQENDLYDGAEVFIKNTKQKNIQFTVLEAIDITQKTLTLALKREIKFQKS